MDNFITRLFYSFLFIFITFNSGMAQNPTSNDLDNYPIITFEQPFIDIGTIDEGDIIEFDIVFTNTGKAPLAIEIVTACKCIDISWPQGEIRPTESGSIKVVFDSLGQGKGDIEKTIDIISNTKPIVVEAKMKGKIL